MASFIAGGAIATKQAALVLLPFFPIIAWECASVFGRSFTKRDAAVMLGLMGVVGLPWYLHSHYLISQNIIVSEIKTVTFDIFDGRTLSERVYGAIRNFPAVFLMFFFSLYGLTCRGSRVITLTGVAYTIAWSFFGSYSNRNETFGMLFLCIGAGFF